MIYYDTKDNKIKFFSYEKLKQIFCEGCGDCFVSGENFNNFMKSGFIVEESYNTKINKRVTKYFILDLHKISISNKSFIDKNIIKKIVRNVRNKKLIKLNDQSRQILH